MPVLVGELLRERPAPGDAEDVHHSVAQLIEHVSQKMGEARKPKGDTRCRRLAGARQVDPDRLDSSVERVDEGLEQLEVDPEAIQEQQW